MNSKQIFRKQVLKHRRGLSCAERNSASAHIQKTLLLQLKQRQLATVPLLIYKAMDDEVDTCTILNTKRPFMFAPVTHTHDHMRWYGVDADTRWKTGTFGIQEPMSDHLWNPELHKSVLVCPLVGFDRTGNRLGFGAGCFDRWLAQFNQYLLMTIGLAFSCQEVPDIPVETHDVPLDMIITEREVIECRKR